MPGCAEQEKRRMFVLRRTKEATVRERLTTKRDNIVFCKLSVYQERAYRRFVVRVRPCACNTCVGLPSS
jgi:SNF2 family DNA or RNA helicase